MDFLLSKFPLNTMAEKISNYMTTDTKPGLNREKVLLTQNIYFFFRK